MAAKTYLAEAKQRLLITTFTHLLLDLSFVAKHGLLLLKARNLQESPSSFKFYARLAQERILQISQLICSEEIPEEEE